jgi:hypothetical protein
MRYRIACIFLSVARHKRDALPERIDAMLTFFRFVPRNECVQFGIGGGDGLPNIDDMIQRIRATPASAPKQPMVSLVELSTLAPPAN